MDQLINTLQERYIEDIRARYPIYRMLCLYMCLISFYIYQQCDSSNILSSLKEMKLTFLWSVETGILSLANVYQLIAAVIMVATAGKLNNYIKSSFFEFFAKIYDLDAYTKKIRGTIKLENVTESMEKNISKDFEDKKSTLKAFQAKSEIFIVCVACISINMSQINWLEIAICILLIGGVIDQQWNCYKYYLSKFIPHYIANQIALRTESSESEISKDAFK